METEQERLGAWLNLVQAHAAVVDSLQRKLESEKGLPLPWHEVLMRLVDVALALPGLLLALLILTSLGPSSFNLVVAIAIVFVPKSALRKSELLFASSRARLPSLFE